MRLFWLLLIPPLFALDNSVVVWDRSGVTNSNRVVSISRLFAEGEIATCAEAFVTGSAVTSQTDVKSRWPGGSLKHAIVSFEIASITANGSVTVDFRNTATCNNAGYKTYADLNASAAWGAQLETTANALTQTRNAETMLTACGSISTDGFSSACRYWLRGPLVTQVIIEDRSTARAQAFGYEIVASVWAVATTDTFKSLHPIFVVTVSSPSIGGPFYHVETILENTWMDRLQRQAYTFVIKTGNALTTVYTRATAWSHLARARWSIRKWSGTAPGAIFIDYNLNYLIHSKAVPQYDPTKTPSATAANAKLAEYDTNQSTEEPALCAGATMCDNILRYMPNTGGRADIALFPGWYALYLKSMGNANMTLAKREEIYNKLLLGNAYGAGAAPNHYRESLTDRCYNDTGATKYSASAGCNKNAFGLVHSVDARPTFRSWIAAGGCCGESVAGLVEDRVTRACVTGECNAETVDGWDSDSENARAHTPSFSYIPYLITGDWYFLEESYFWAAVSTSNGADNELDWGRHNDWGFANGQVRTYAWSVRNIAHAALMAPDDSSEKYHFTSKLNNNLAVYEGIFGMTDGSFYDPATTSMWYWGRNTIADGATNPLRTIPFRSEDMRTGSSTWDSVDFATGQAFTADRHFQELYTHPALGHIEELFPLAIPVAAQFHKAVVGQILDAGFRPVIAVEAYSYPIRPTGTTYYQTWAAVFDDIVKSGTLNAAISSTTATSFTFTTPDTGKWYDWGGAVTIDTEVIHICSLGITGPAAGLYTHTATVGIDGGACPGVGGRGWQGTTAATHANGATATRQYSRITKSGDQVFDGGYPGLAWAALAFVSAKNYATEGWRGSKAWDWIYSNKGYQSSFNDMPDWSFTPRHIIGSLQVLPGSTQVLFQFTAPAEVACGVLVQAAAIVDSRDSGDTAVAAGSVARSLVIGSLTTSTTYYYRVTCGTARTLGSTATLATGTGTNVSVQLAAPAGMSVDDAIIDYGATGALGLTTTAVTCTSTCTVQVPGTTRQVLYYRVKLRDSADVVLRTGAILAVVP